MSEPRLLVGDEGPVRWLTLNRPGRRNALDAALVNELREALAAAAEASGPRCVAITGAGSVFSAGADLDALRNMRDAGYEANLKDSRLLAGLFLDIARHPLPVIAAVNGAALGGGAGLAIACDFTLAVPDAPFGFTEVRVGFVPAIVLNFLLRTVGEKTARDLCLTGRRLEAREAAVLGLVRTVEPERLAAEAAALGAGIAQAGPAAVARTKRLFLRLGPLALEDGLDQAATENAEARGTAECREGIDAFLEKRPPRWITELDP